LLLARGQMVGSEEQLADMLAHGLFVHEHETEAYQREVAHALDNMVRGDNLLGNIAKAKPDVRLPQADAFKPDAVAGWPDLYMRANTLLREPRVEDFMTRLERLREDVLWHVNQDADRSLLSLVHQAGEEVRYYSASHAMLVMVVCHLIAGKLGWSDDWRRSLELAALTMNIASTAMQDQLAEQIEELTPTQRSKLDKHALDSEQLLTRLGVDDLLWLEAVLFHHDKTPGPLAERPPGRQMARLIQRADVFGSRLSVRRSRKAQSASAAAQAAYLDENKQADEAGAALIKAIGIYPPGCLVRLANGEIAVVLKRGRAANAPLVATVIGKSGTPLTEPAVRDTRLQTQAVTGTLARHEVNLRLSLERLIKLA
jgi:HD-GYP domain-containing protein (c-di-GMP phosphodiesterase class II)